MKADQIAESDRPRPPNIDHLIRHRWVEMGFSDKEIAEIEAFVKAKAEELRALHHDGPGSGE